MMSSRKRLDRWLNFLSSRYFSFQRKGYHINSPCWLWRGLDPWRIIDSCQKYQRCRCGLPSRHERRTFWELVWKTTIPRIDIIIFRTIMQNNNGKRAISLPSIVWYTLKNKKASILDAVQWIGISSVPDVINEFGVNHGSLQRMTS